MPGHTGGHEGKGFGSGFGNGSTGSSSGSSSGSTGGATGPGGQTPGRGPGGRMMAGASPDDLSRATTEGFDTTRGFDQNVRDKGSFVERIKAEEDESNPIRVQDIGKLYDALKNQNINPNQVNLKNYTTGPFAQKNVVMFGDKRIGQFGQVPTFGISGLVSSIFDLDTRNLMLDQSTFGDPFDGRGDNRTPDDIMEILYPGSPDVPGEGEDRGEGSARLPKEVPVIGYDLAFKDFYGQQLPTRGFKPMRDGGLASLPMNFNPMTNANPFSMMMRGGR